ncbi:hypothetical protein CYFUS_005904 [Cystobacter fuscus]|uniref:Uncharacterized protein n=1 Tax=Cystobacter fuscus TaxID=43 RepID=A0A250J974_9BACT|nr:hypothetical protein [Cystobacter fuscus]ATB40455.1 hypothetical protein CYFUS_005904 [Cystobacter fuscus]
MKPEHLPLLSGLFALMGSILAAAVGISKPSAERPELTKPLTWLARIHFDLGVHARLVLATMGVCVWLVPLTLGVIQVVKGQLLSDDDQPAHPSAQCPGVEVPGFPNCARDMWQDTDGRCEYPKNVYTFTKGDFDEDRRLYCLMLDLGNRGTPIRPD